MYAVELENYLQTNIQRLYPNALYIPLKQVLLKFDSGTSRMNISM